MEFEWHVIWSETVALLSSPNAPVWFQAILTLVGLAIAIYVSTLPIKHATRERRASVLAITEAAHSRVQGIRNAVDNLDWKAGGNIELYRVYHKSIIDGVVRALQGVPMHELGKSKVVLSLLSLTDQLVFLGLAVEELLNGPYKHPEMSKTFDSIEPDNYKERQKLCEVGYSVLKHNVIIHIDQIEIEYKTLRESWGV